MRHGLHFQVSHHLAKNLTTSKAKAESGVTTQNAYDRRADWADYGLTRRHRFVASSPGIAVRPATRGGRPRALAQTPCGGWTVSISGCCRTGSYFNPTFSGRDPPTPAQRWPSGTGSQMGTWTTRRSRAGSTLRLFLAAHQCRALRKLRCQHPARPRHTLAQHGLLQESQHQPKEWGLQLEGNFHHTY